MGTHWSGDMTNSIFFPSQNQNLRVQTPLGGGQGPLAARAGCVPGRRGGVGRFELLGQGNRQGRRCEGQHSGSSSSVDRCVHCMLSSMPNSE